MSSRLLTPTQNLPNVVYGVLRDIHGTWLGALDEPHDGTPDGMRAATGRLQAAADRTGYRWGGESSWIATDASGKAAWRISQNLNVVEPVRGGSADPAAKRKVPRKPGRKVAPRTSTAPVSHSGPQVAHASAVTAAFQRKGFELVNTGGNVLAYHVQDPTIGEVLVSDEGELPLSLNAPVQAWFFGTEHSEHLLRLKFASVRAFLASVDDVRRRAKPNGRRPAASRRLVPAPVAGNPAHRHAPAVTAAFKARGFGLWNTGGDMLAYRLASPTAGEVLVTDAGPDAGVPHGLGTPVTASFYGPGRSDPLLELKFASVRAFLASLVEPYAGAKPNGRPRAPGAGLTPAQARLLARLVARAQRWIIADVQIGHVPRTVPDFATLHDYRDANMYSLSPEGEIDAAVERAFPPTRDGEDRDYSDAYGFLGLLQDRLDAWVKSGALRKVTLKPGALATLRREAEERKQRNAGYSYLAKPNGATAAKRRHAKRNHWRAYQKGVNEAVAAGKPWHCEVMLPMGGSFFVRVKPVGDGSWRPEVEADDMDDYQHAVRVLGQEKVYELISQYVRSDLGMGRA